jgi:hypothetical protein
VRKKLRNSWVKVAKPNKIKYINRGWGFGATRINKKGKDGKRKRGGSRGRWG